MNEQESIINNFGENPIKFVHNELAKVYGKYDLFDKLMKDYSEQAVGLNITRAINVINYYRDDMKRRNLEHYLPIINVLEDRLENLSLACIGKTK